MKKERKMKDNLSIFFFFYLDWILIFLKAKIKIWTLRKILWNLMSKKKLKKIDKKKYL